MAVILSKGKRIPVSNLKKKRVLGQGAEGTAYLVTGTTRTPAGKIKPIQLVEKRFTLMGPILGPLRLLTFILRPNFAMPQRQFRMVSELIQLNESKGLGIRLPRIVGINKRLIWPSSILTSKLRVKKGINRNELTAFVKDRQRQADSLLRNGYDCDSDSFFPVQLKGSGIVAVLADFGTLRRKRKKE